MNDFTWQIKL